MTSANAIIPNETMEFEESPVLHALLDATRIALVVVDAARQVAFWSAAAQKMFGWEQRQIVGRKLSVLSTDKGLENCLASASLNGVYHCDILCQNHEGTNLPVEVWARQISPGHGRVLLAMRDVTETKFLEHAFLDAADHEQKRMAQEMHDHLCQQILGTAFAVKALAGELDREGSPHAVQLHELARLVNQTVTQIRDVSRSLHPVELEAGGLRSAIQTLADRMAHSLSCEFHCSTNVARANTECALHAYRIAQEAVFHAFHHTGATKVSIDLSSKGGSLRLEIADNGQTEGPATADPNHIATKTLHYRAKAIHGELGLRFKSGVGTNVTCTFPQSL
jgi:PAS domain S-box-containing protein